MTLLYAWAMLSALFGACERQHLQNLVNRSHQVHVGATEADVLAILGEPKFSWEKRGRLAAAIFGVRSRQWIYGTTLDLRWLIIPDQPFPNPLPLKLRLFSYPDEEDLVVNWGADNTVESVFRPDLTFPAHDD